MHSFFLARWLRNMSIARKLYFTVGLMAVLIALELATLLFAVKILPSIRTCVTAESLWSKAQKEAVFNLKHYTASRNETDYNKYLSCLAVPLGDRKALLECEKKNPDTKVITEGLLEGRMHPDDIDGAVMLMTRFKYVSYIAKSKAIWKEGDRRIEQLQQTAAALHKEINTAADEARIRQLITEIDNLDTQLTALEDNFSFTLGAGSRWLASVIIKLLLVLVVTMDITGLVVAMLISRGIAAGLNEIISSLQRITKGDFSKRVRIDSKDEIGLLGSSFNEMTNKLEENIIALKKSEEELSTAKVLAERSALTKEHFLANMSHEIRTPLNAVIGFTNLLETTELTDQQKEFANAIKIAGKNLQLIIDDILDYSKITSGIASFEQIPLSVRNIFKTINIILSPKASEKHLSLSFHIDPNVPLHVLGDPTRLNQILTNLIDNAIKFSEKGSITVNAVATEETDSSATVLFTVSDTGNGIPDDKINRIFDLFTQASEETSRQYGGTGLGLSLVKKLVELQNGTVSVQSKIREGSMFSFKLPFKKIPAADIAAAAINKQPEQKRAARILVAEDNLLNQMLVQHFSSKHGFETDVAENGKIALEKLKANSYDVILMDIQMPEMDGYEATTIIRDVLKSDIPIIAFTAHALDGEKEKCISLGMNDFITKPFDPADLYNKITFYLN